VWAGGAVWFSNMVRTNLQLSHDGAPHILLIEDDTQIRDLLASYLATNDMNVTSAGDGNEADQYLATSKVDLIVLDRMLPGEDGIQICRRLRSADIPIIMLTALTTEDERVRGLDTGADDYVGKPFSPRELVSRIRAVLRRKGRDRFGRATRAYRFAGWYLDLHAQRLYDPTGTRILLTSGEFHLLQIFCENAGEALSRETIVGLTRNKDLGSSERSVDILVSRLRQKLLEDPKDPRLLITVRLAGYLFTPPVLVE
jgi:two-component system OmpR family response regulator